MAQTCDSDDRFVEICLLFRYNPVEYIPNWSTPMLIVHGSKDYRLPETDGIGAFHALQQ
jgi:dipeptidyl aminopeptidase/acylaminoacyl peptidase